MKFVIQYQPVRADFLTTMTLEEGQAVRNHFLYLQKLSREGRLYFAGRRDDAAFGLAVVDASSERDAAELLASDPVVKAGVFKATIGRFSFALAKDPDWI